ncbi:probable serine/threonine-protein kinase At1g54610 [Phalaenopsis equestris]|uniref:probable serine/threonine-protein kinase At1g54610 n=1 Tax=Phalaenopsis equestris TaxID=78828 RepID=UPI0009E5CABB|nr:probable serine/threonine-protein kinase At1g54610 [Phalaenopsis equestris]
MGCASSKKAVSVTPALDSSGILRVQRGSVVVLENSLRQEERKVEEPSESEKASLKRIGSVSLRLGNLHKYIEGELVAAGWPAWLTAVAGEAISGWVPLKADNFEKLDKIGQGTYSTVFRARDLETGKIVALKKVRFDNFEPESVRFMAREIQILRRLDHPNVMKLEGLVTSRISCSIYLVFGYMEHDLAGLSSSPDIKFTEAQVKCLMEQLLSGLEHCHSRGIIHRDIKGANLLLNDEGVLKIADFGLANFLQPENKQPLTSRVVTLWYRPPELLLGSYDYGVSVDLWSVGCVFAELFLKKAILQGRTEVEQLHKIFKLCGSPSDEYWNKSKLPHSTIFKPHHPYESHLQETFKILPQCAYNLLEVFLSVEPQKRGTAASALASEYFRTKPVACEPSSLPKCPPTKEIDAKIREGARRRNILKVDGKARAPDVRRRRLRVHHEREQSSGLNTFANHHEAVPQMTNHGTDRSGENIVFPIVKGDDRLLVDLQLIPALKHPDQDPNSTHISQKDIPFSVPMDVNPSTGFAWAKKQQEDSPYDKSRCKSSSKSNLFGVEEPLFSAVRARASSDLENGRIAEEEVDRLKRSEHYKMVKKAMLRSWAQLQHPDSFDSSSAFHSQDFLKGDDVQSKNSILVYEDGGERVEFSGPLLSKSQKVDELLQKHERQIRQAVRRSWFLGGRKQVK